MGDARQTRSKGQRVTHMPPANQKLDARALVRGEMPLEILFVSHKGQPQPQRSRHHDRWHELLSGVTTYIETRLQMAHEA